MEVHIIDANMHSPDCRKCEHLRSSHCCVFDFEIPKINTAFSATELNERREKSNLGKTRPQQLTMITERSTAPFGEFFLVRC
jgi:hypothetical protein